MVNVIKLRKGLDINLQGKAEQTKIGLKPAGLYALQPDDFTGVVPKVVVKEGEQVEAGQALFVDKNHPEIFCIFYKLCYLCRKYHCKGSILLSCTKRKNL